jgi:hypothetical protein
MDNVKLRDKTESYKARVSRVCDEAYDMFYNGNVSNAVDLLVRQNINVELFLTWAREYQVETDFFTVDDAIDLWELVTELVKKTHPYRVRYVQTTSTLGTS